MDESLRQAHQPDTWRESFAQSLSSERRRASERISHQRQKLTELDARISGEIETAVHALSREQEQAQQAALSTQTKIAALDERQKLLDQRQKQLDTRQSELDKLHAELAASKLTEVERQKDAKRRETEIAAAKEAQDAALASLQAERDALRERESNLTLSEQTLAAREQQTKRQRQTVARQLRARKAELLAEAAWDQKSREADSLEHLRRESQQQFERLRTELAAARSGEVQTLRQQLADLHTRLASTETARDEAIEACEEQRATTRKTDSASQATSGELNRLREENRQLQAQLAEAEERVESSGAGSTQELDDLRRRFEMAVQDVRELKTKNVELTEQLAEAQKARPAASAPIAACGGWESMKQKLMADLDSDFDESKPTEKADKINIENTIKITDEIVADKDREIEELQRLLDSQAKQVGDMAVGAAAVSQLLDTDELVQQEREALKRLQDQLRDQLRQAELDFSVERARLARERTELEEKLRSLEVEKTNLTSIYGQSPSNSGKKPTGRKWLTRLGLGESGEEPSGG